MTERYYRNRRILNNYNHLLKEIDDLACACAELETSATKINQTLSDEPSPANHDAKSRVESDCIRLAQMKEKLEKAIAKRARIDKAISRLSYKRRFLVTEIDIKGFSVAQTAKKLGMNYNYACNLHADVVEGMRF